MESITQMKNIIISLLFVAISIVSFSQGFYNRWVPTSGTDTYTTNITSFTSLSNSVIYVKFTNTNTTAATITINGTLGPAPIRAWDGDSWEVLTGGELDVNTIYKLSYQGSYYELEGIGGGGISDGDKGDITVSSSGTTWTIDNNVVTSAKLSSMSSSDLAGKISDETGTGSLVFSASPALTGTPTAPTAATSTNTTQIASTAFVQQELLTLANARTITTSVAIAQSDNLKTIFFNSASPINFTLDALTTNTEVTLINIGTGTVTFLNGTGVTFSGSSTLTAGNSGFIKYTSSTTPLVLAGADVPTATSSTSGIAKLYTSTGSNTDGAMDQNSATNAFILRTGTTSGVTGAVLTQTAASSGTPKMITFTPGAHTGLTASTEVIDIDFDLNRTVQRAAGTVTSQRSVVFRAPTYSFVSSSTINDAATVAITGAPVAGTNATISNRQSLWVQGGISTFGSTVQSGYTGSLVATVNASNRIALLGAFEFVNSGSPSYSGIGVSLPGSGRTLSYYGGTLGNASDFSSSVWSSTSLGTARAGTNLSNVSITMPSTNSSVFTATDYSLLTLDGTPPTLTTPLSVWYGMKVLPGSAGNATKNVAIYTNSNAGNIELGSNLVLYNVGSGISIKEGTNATMGLATLVAGTVTVNTTKVTANSRIMLTRQNLGTITVPVGLAVSARSSGTSFTILSGDLSDTSTIAWQIIEPAP